ncbi:MAG: glycosyltransferase family 4 protein [Acidobacteria bacterium]|nr:glycosyltransferase family 4 protein [Acidobacteriota bacterium]
MRLFIHALGASAGGGLTYLRNMLPELAGRRDVSVTVLAGEAADGLIPPADNIKILVGSTQGRGVLSRFWWEQKEIPKLIRQAGADVLLSAGNFAVWNSPVPQILLSRNSLYLSPDFSLDLRHRGEYRMWADTKLKGLIARQSILRAQLTLAPSDAFARELRSWTGHEVAVLHHGFGRDHFVRDATPLPPEIQERLAQAEQGTRLLFVSHYNYYRNFETLLRAVALLKQSRRSAGIRLFLTCELAPGKNPGSYRTDKAQALLQELQIEECVVQLGAIPYQQLHHLYRACDVYVSPAYTETFAHPLLEAMACGLPIVASDLPVHREITNGAALFFERNSPSELAARVAQLLDSPTLRSDLREQGLRRAENFSWKDHADGLLSMATRLLQETSR